MMILRGAYLTLAIGMANGHMAAADDIAMLPEAYFASECAQCHGRTARGMASFPSLRDKSAELLAERLRTYRAGDAVGPNSALMYPVAEVLDDNQIETLASYIAEAFN